MVCYYLQYKLLRSFYVCVSADRSFDQVVIAESTGKENVKEMYPMHSIAKINVIAVCKLVYKSMYGPAFQINGPVPTFYQN